MVFSPDGLWLWNGSEWIPNDDSGSMGAAPAGETEVVIETATAQVLSSISDSVMMGDVTQVTHITQNDPKEIAKAIISTFRELGVHKGGEFLLSPQFNKERANSLIDEVGRNQGVSAELDAESLYKLGEASRLFARYTEAELHYQRGEAKAKLELNRVDELFCQLGQLWLVRAKGDPARSLRGVNEVIKTANVEGLIKVELLACHHAALCCELMSVDFGGVAERALQLSNLDDSTVHCKALAFLTMAMHLTSQEQIEEARPFIIQSNALAESIGDVEMQIITAFHSFHLLEGDDDIAPLLTMFSNMQGQAERHGHVLMAATLAMFQSFFQLAFQISAEAHTAIPSTMAGIRSECSKLLAIAENVGDMESVHVAKSVLLTAQYLHWATTDLDLGQTDLQQLGREYLDLSMRTGFREGEDVVIPALTLVNIDGEDNGYDQRLLDHAMGHPKAEKEPGIRASILIMQAMVEKNVRGHGTGDAYDLHVWPKMFSARTIVRAEQPDFALWVEEFVSSAEVLNVDVERKEKALTKWLLTDVKRETAYKNIGGGFLFFVLGAGLTAATGGLFLFWGLMLVGAIEFAVGLLQLLFSGFG